MDPQGKSTVGDKILGYNGEDRSAGNIGVVVYLTKIKLCQDRLNEDGLMEWRRFDLLAVWGRQGKTWER